MPNWCSNYAEIKHDDASKLKWLFEEIAKPEPLFNKIIPCPPELLDENLTSWGGDNAAENDAKRAAMKDKYGYPSWYDWRIEHWGTKWDVSEFTINDFSIADQVLDLQFETAWSPPLPIYEKLKEMGFVIKAEYVDEGMGFVGLWDDGNDECYGSKADVPDYLSHLWPSYDDEGELI